MPTPLRVASLNVKRLSERELHRAARIGSFVGELGCDIVALQEIEGPSAEAVASHAGFAHVTWVGHAPSRRRGVALLHREPALSASGARVPARLGDDKGYTRVRLAVDDGGTPAELEIIALHLDWLSRRARARQIDSLARALGTGDGPRVVLGDLNAMTLRAYLRGADADDTVLALALALGVTPARVIARTFPSHAPRWALDWILASPALSLGGVRVSPTDLSDHAAISAEVSFAEAA